MPDRDHVPRIGDVVARIVDDDVGEPRSNQHPDNQVPDPHIYAAIIQHEQPAIRSALRELGSEYEGEYVHGPIPPHGQWTDAKYLRRYARIRERHRARVIPRAARDPLSATVHQAPCRTLTDSRR